MENELSVNDLTVVFRNEFNKEIISGLTAKEHDLLLAMIGKLKRRGLDEISVNFNEIRELLNDNNLDPIEITRLSDSLWDKVKTVDYKLYAFGRPSGGVPLFAYWGISEEKQTLNVQINPALEYFVNSFEKGNYSSLRYRDFQQTKDRYGKLLYRVLMQWKAVGKVKLDLNELEYKLDIPLSYRGKPYIINDKVLKPAIKSLVSFFDNLEVNKIKTGRRITHYEFTFTPQENVKQWDPSLSKKNKNKPNRKNVTPAGIPLENQPSEAEIEAFLKERY